MKWSTIRALGKVKYFNICYFVLIGVPLLAEGFVWLHKLGFAELTPKDLKNPQAFASALKDRATPVSDFLAGQLSPSTLDMLEVYSNKAPVPEALKLSLVRDVNGVITNAEVFDELRFSNVHLRPETKRRLNPGAQGEELAQLNRLLLEDAYPMDLSRKLRLDKYPSLPASLKLLYLASICYAIGIALYQYCCPSIIKAYDRDIDYYQAEKDVHSRARPDRKLEIVLTNLAPQQQAVSETLEELIREQAVSPNSAREAEIDSVLAQHEPSCVQRFLLAEYARQNRKWPFVITVCGLFYLAGTVIMLWLLVHKSIKVFTA